ncbi:MAG: hypothetical protein HY360_09670 [Verrucomicrobia bacterium]|nr:hypothetical protein [Verrucomicrobiota bacterium]
MPANANATGFSYRIYAENFELRRESVLRELRGELLEMRWQPSGYRSFRIFDPKERIISAAPYPDRILHHAFCNIIAPIAERLKAHPTKCRVLACRDGMPFLGFRFFPERTRVLRQNVLRFRARMLRLRQTVRRDHNEMPKVWPSMLGWFQFVREQSGGEGLVLAECQSRRF